MQLQSVTPTFQYCNSISEFTNLRQALIVDIIYVLSKKDVLDFSFVSESWPVLLHLLTLFIHVTSQHLLTCELITLNVKFRTLDILLNL